MKIVIMSRREIEAVQFEGPSIAICLAYPNGRLHKVMPIGETPRAVHHARFSDCDGEGKWCFPGSKGEENKPIPMTRGQAIDILDFVKKWKDEVNIIYIACYGGVSRSAGIGAGLCAVFGWDDTEIYKTRIPNVHCKSLLMQEATPTPKL